MVKTHTHNHTCTRSLTHVMKRKKKKRKKTQSQKLRNNNNPFSQPHWVPATLGIVCNYGRAIQSYRRNRITLEIVFFLFLFLLPLEIHLRNNCKYCLSCVVVVVGCCYSCFLKSPFPSCVSTRSINRAPRCGSVLVSRTTCVFDINLFVF